MLIFVIDSAFDQLGVHQRRRRTYLLLLRWPADDILDQIRIWRKIAALTISSVSIGRMPILALPDNLRRLRWGRSTHDI